MIIRLETHYTEEPHDCENAGKPSSEAQITAYGPCAIRLMSGDYWTDVAKVTYAVEHLKDDPGVESVTVYFPKAELVKKYDEPDGCVVYAWRDLLRTFYRDCDNIFRCVDSWDLEKGLISAQDAVKVADGKMDEVRKQREQMTRMFGMAAPASAANEEDDNLN